MLEATCLYPELRERMEKAGGLGLGRNAVSQGMLWLAIYLLGSMQFFHALPTFFKEPFFAA